MLKDECFNCKFEGTVTCNSGCNSYPPYNKEELLYYEVLCFLGLDNDGRTSNRWEIDEYCEELELELDTVRHYPEGCGLYQEERYYVAVQAKDIVMGVKKASAMIEDFRSTQQKIVDKTKSE